MDYKYSLEKYHHAYEEMKNLIDLKYLSLYDNVLVVKWDKERLNESYF